MTNLQGASGASPEQLLVEAELQALIKRHGKAAVRCAATKLCKGRVGRKVEPDWPLLAPYVQADADAWLDGKIPEELRKNNAIAEDFAEKYPGQSRASTHRRIMGKLAKHRVTSYLSAAWKKSENYRPHADYFRAGEALIAHDNRFQNLVSYPAETKKGALARYRDKLGEPPAEMTIAEIAKLAGRHPTAIPMARLLSVLGLPA
ncbi:hypothetical protein GCM10011529_30110 [Polymorphobacter glacialis]|uniref:Uncharacterized protein n=1 Tax=Sandarakinorhabdus glacialis TaxID=1614636 RepID=A0A917A0T7_9SPHN|nr:hypothetical protein [Polymorphobacter glacialis]GGE21452.1 hypothetical protein GCM10011529_30110 [Polymorphobacter glacialis]